MVVVQFLLQETLLLLQEVQVEVEMVEDQMLEQLTLVVVLEEILLIQEMLVVVE